MMFVHAMSALASHGAHVAVVVVVVVSLHWTWIAGVSQRIGHESDVCPSEDLCLAMRLGQLSCNSNAQKCLGNSGIHRSG